MPSSYWREASGAWIARHRAGRLSRRRCGIERDGDGIADHSARLVIQCRLQYRAATDFNSHAQSYSPTACNTGSCAPPRNCAGTEPWLRRAAFWRQPGERRDCNPVGRRLRYRDGFPSGIGGVRPACDPCSPRKLCQPLRGRPPDRARLPWRDKRRDGNAPGSYCPGLPLGRALRDRLRIDRPAADRWLREPGPALNQSKAAISRPPRMALFFRK